MFVLRAMLDVHVRLDVFTNSESCLFGVIENNEYIYCECTTRTEYASVYSLRRTPPGILHEMLQYTTSLMGEMRNTSEKQYTAQNKQGNT